MRFVLAKRTTRLGLACLFAMPTAASAQPRPGFTIDDVLDVKSVSVSDLSDDGRWVVLSTRTLRDRIGADNSRFGDPTYVAPTAAETHIVNAETGESRRLFDDRRDVRTVTWSPDASRLAIIVREGDAFRLGIWDRASARIRYVPLPSGRILAETGPVQWSADGRTLLFAMRTTSWREEAQKRFLAETQGPIIVQSSEDPFLSWEDLRRMSSRQIVATLDIESGRVQDVLEEATVDGVSMSADGSILRYATDITKSTNYDEIFGRETRLEVRPRAGGDARVLMESTKRAMFRWSGDGTAYVYAKEGRTYFGTIDGDRARKLTGIDEPTPGATPEAEPADSATRKEERDRRRKERFTPIELSWDGATLLASNPEGLWLIHTGSGEREMFHAVPEPEEDAREESTLPRWSVAAWTRDARYIYLNFASRTAWERGLYRFDRDTKQLTELAKDGRSYGGLRVSNDGSRIVLTIAHGNDPGDIYAADGELKNLRRLSDANPGLDAKLSRTELIQYLDVDGRKLNGVLYYPLDYQPGTRYPTVFVVYETFFDDRYNSTVSLLTSNGYAVMQPSVHLERGYPGEAWLKGVTAAANKLIDMGIADAERLGVHGTSYGGYATNLLVTQTNRFAAAINISGKVDMISFYTDSPRLGTRNIHAPEKSQDRIGATLWEQPQKYIAHTAIMAADRIETPLLLMTGREDHNVPERTTSEMFYALRRLGKRVEWVSYVNGGHGMPTATVEEAVDYHQRILAWYERYLKKGNNRTAEATGSGGDR